MTLRVDHKAREVCALRDMVRRGTKPTKGREHFEGGKNVCRPLDRSCSPMISKQMRAQVGGLGRMATSSDNGEAVSQSSEAALVEWSRLLSDIRLLALHASNEGANDTAMLEADQAEINKILDHIGCIADLSNFATRHLREGRLDVRTPQGAQHVVSLTEAAIREVSQMREEIGVMQKNVLKHNIVNLNIAKENIIDSDSKLWDTGVVIEMWKEIRYRIPFSSAVEKLPQTNCAPDIALGMSH